MWLYLTLLCAILTATNAALYKIALKENDQYVSAWLAFGISAVVFVIPLFRFLPKIYDREFWILVAITLPFELTAFLTYLKALKISPISLTFPFLALTPLFSVITSYIFLKERPALPGGIGICFVAAGAYLLNAYTISQGVLEPIKHIFKEKGAVLMILVSFIYSITATLSKRAMLHVGPVMFPAIYYPLFFVLLTPLLLYRLKKRFSVININFKSSILFSAIAISFILMAVLHFKAISLTKVSYMISVKRLSLLFAVLYGAVVFKERYIKYRFLGAAIMVIGAVIIAFSQGQ